MELLLDIQGLRCIAVVYVLLFHLWPDYFKAGYLGVDIFFVISGYLMHMILSAKECNLTNIRLFYFRRFRRILPTYLFIIACTVFSALYVFIPTEYNNIFREMTSAVTLTSNIFNLPDGGYFDPSNKFPLFLHTWSLSVELQFYVLVPMIFACYSWCSRRSCGLGVMTILVMGGISLGFQFYFKENVNVSHMHLFSRIWQFLVGFLTHSFKSSSSSSKPQLYEKLPSNNPATETPSQCCSDYNTNIYTTKNALAVIVLTQLTLPWLDDMFLLRVLCTATVSLFLCLGGGSIFEHEHMVSVGDVSYSIYLVHWPMILFVKYVNIGYQSVPWSVGILILQTCFIAGLLVENSFKRLTKWIDNWAKLLFVLAFLYSLIFSSILYQDNQNNIVIDQKEGNVTDEFEDFIQKTFEIYNKKDDHGMSLEEVAKLNEDISKFGRKFINAHRENGTSPSKVRHEVEGTGNRTILIIGNSIAGDLFCGMWGSMKEHYRTLTAYYRAGVIPFYTKPGEKSYEDEYVDYVRDFTAERPVDILIVRHTYHPLLPHNDYIHSNFSTDLSRFYERLNEFSARIGLTVVLYTEFTAYAADFDMQKYNKAMLSGTGDISYFFKAARDRNLKIDQVIGSLNCSNCIKVDLSRAFCDGITDKCTVGLKNGFTTYADNVHTSMFGSFYLVEELKETLKRIGAL